MRGDRPPAPVADHPWVREAGSGNQAVAFIHFVNALAIFGAMLSGTFMALRWEHMPIDIANDRQEAVPGIGPGLKLGPLNPR